MQDRCGLRTQGSADKADVSVLSGAYREEAQETFWFGAAGSREAMPDNPEVFAPEQHHRADTSVRNQAPDNQRDQADVFFPIIRQAGRQFRREMGPDRQ